MDITKDDSKVLKGVAILGMLMLHLFCRTENLPYTPLFWGGDTPLIYYFGLFGDICVSIYCFISGYAHYMQSSDPLVVKRRWNHLLRFMIIYWVIVILFSVIGFLTHNKSVPGNIAEFILNFITIKNSYDGAWWYANTYIILVALQPLSYRFVKKFPAVLAIVAAFIFYNIGYGIRFWGWGESEYTVVSWMISHLGLFGTSFFPYVIGMLFCKKQLIRKFRELSMKLSNALLCAIALVTLVGMKFMHGIFRSLYVAVITATVTICLVCICPLPKWTRSTLKYIGSHSTNIWLTHMFFYMSFFNGFAFRAKYPILVLLLLLVASLATSYVVNFISKPILKLVR